MEVVVAVMVATAAANGLSLTCISRVWVWLDLCVCLRVHDVPHNLTGGADSPRILPQTVACSGGNPTGLFLFLVSPLLSSLDF